MFGTSDDEGSDDGYVSPSFAATGEGQGICDLRSEDPPPSAVFRLGSMADARWPPFEVSHHHASWVAPAAGRPTITSVTVALVMVVGLGRRSSSLASITGGVPRGARCSLVNTALFLQSW